MKFARRVFAGAGIYGIAILAPLLFTEDLVAGWLPPAMTHPEFYYGFVALALAWQVAFLIIAADPTRYRPLMLAAILEKFGFAAAVFILILRGRLSMLAAPAATIDALLGCLFLAAYAQTSARARHRPSAGFASA